MSESTRSKIHVDVNQGVVEIEGSEEFIENQIGLLESIVNLFVSMYEESNDLDDTLKDVVEYEVEPGSSAIEESPTEQRRDYLASGFTKEQLENVYCFLDDGTFEIIITRIPGATTMRAKQEAYSLLYCFAKGGSADQNELRQVCEHFSCYDTNFSKTFRNNTNFVVRGPRGSSLKKITLTAPGTVAAKTIIQSVLGGEMSA